MRVGADGLQARSRVCIPLTITTEPHTKIKTIHVAGTNSKGSVSHTLSAVLQVTGYKVGLYTSPHLLDFSERIRINGQPIDEQYVLDFVEQGKELFETGRRHFL